MARTLVSSDIFLSSTFPGWVNGPGDWDTMAWVNSSVINETAVTGRGVIVRDSGTYPYDQYSKVVLKGMVHGAGFYADCCAMVLAQQASAECYIALLRCAANTGDEFRIYEADSSTAFTLLANTGTALDTYNEDSYIVLESDGAGGLNFYANINGAGESSVLTASDGTIVSGRPAVSANAGTGSAVTDAQVKSWEGGSMGLTSSSAQPAKFYSFLMLGVS